MRIDFDKMGGVVPAICQDYKSKEVLMLGYMNRQAWKKTTSTSKVTFWSRSRKKLWTKGETSGNFMLVKKAYLDCDGDTILIEVRPSGPICHTGKRSCFFKEI